MSEDNRITFQEVGETMRESQARALAANVSGEALRLMAALHFYLVGYAQVRDVIARAQLCEIANFKSNHSLERARDELLAAKAIDCVTTGKGRGSQTTWRYLSDEDVRLGEGHEAYCEALFRNQDREEKRKVWDGKNSRTNGRTNGP